MTTTAKDRDRALAQAKPEDIHSGEPDIDMDDEVGLEDSSGLLTGQDALGSKVIVIHPGSQNLRIGLASDALPKTIPMVIARKWRLSESEEGRGEPKPKRLKLDDGTELEPEKMFGEDVRNGNRWHPSLLIYCIVCKAVHNHVCRFEAAYAEQQAASFAELERACGQL